MAVRLLTGGVNTGLGADETGEAAAAWLAAKGDDQALCVEKLELVDYAYQELLTDEADDPLDVAGCAIFTVGKRAGREHCATHAGGGSAG